MVKALIVIDMLEGYMKDTNNPETIIENQIKLIKEFKKLNLKVILAVHDQQKAAENPVMLRLWGEELKDDPEGRKVVNALAKYTYDKIVKKSEYSAFYRTDLEEYCRKHNIDELYVTGVFCGCCVFFSAVDAAYRRIQPYLVTDAAGVPKALVHGWQKETHEKFKTMIGPLITTEELIKELHE